MGDDKSPLVAPIFDLFLSLAQVVDLVSPLVADHRKHTAGVAIPSTCKKMNYLRVRVLFRWQTSSPR